MRIRFVFAFCALSLCCLVCDATNAASRKNIDLVISNSANVRVQYGVQKLAGQLKAAGYTTRILKLDKITESGNAIIVGLIGDPLIKQAFSEWHIRLTKAPEKEGFAINSTVNHNILITGTDNSGALYGCLELADELKANHTLPEKVALTDQPEMTLRGACVGLQKPVLLPGRGTYEYPYTPENFPWFYDKTLWLRYLDSLAENRMNSLYLWNGHPFASLVKVKDYPYALEVNEATFKKNEEMYDFLTREADRRGIWIIQGFYNIIISKPFAEHNNLKTQDRSRHIVPMIADYTRKSIAEFVKKYPNVGLLITLGEAMEGVGQDDIDWFTKTIIPGVKDGLKALGRTDEPPIVLRAHDTDAPEDMKYALPLYKNLYTMAKYNGEALTTYEPHGPWAELHKTLSRIGTVQIENVHILANLEPFRYGSDDFIQKCVQAMHDIYGSRGLHIYPQASYWDWPYTADNSSTRLLEMERDWIWYKEWSRYAWNCRRDRAQEVKYWSRLLGERFGCDDAHGKEILEAYERSGEIAPKILRRFGITDGNRQTMTLGMTMSELVDPEKFGLFSLLYNSEGPEGEMLSEYALKEWKHGSHKGETPVKVINDIMEEGRKAVEAIDRSSTDISSNKAEFARLKNDIYCYNELAESYAHRAKAALSILRYRYSNNISDLEHALPDMQIGLDHYKQLVNLTKSSYLYANSMQTGARKIPLSGKGGKNKTWADLLPFYQQELENFKRNLDSLKSPQANAEKRKIVHLVDGAVTFAPVVDSFKLLAGSTVFKDTTAVIKNIAPELVGLQGIQLNKNDQLTKGTTISFTSTKPVKVLVGFFDSKEKQYLKEPQLETDASANDYGQADIKIANAIQIAGMPSVNVHAYTFGAGTNKLTLDKGICLILGVVNGDANVPVYDAGLSNEGNIRDMRWLFN